MPKKITITIFAIIIGFVLLGLGKQIFSALNAGQRLDSAVEEVSNLQKDNKELQKQLELVQNVDFLEEVARNKLNLTKPNETIVIIPQEEISKIISTERKIEKPKLANWQGWLKLFFN